MNDDIPDEVPANVGELRALLTQHGRARCDGLLSQILGATPALGQLVTVSGHTYRVCGVPGTATMWLEQRPFAPVHASHHPAGLPHIHHPGGWPNRR